RWSYALSSRLLVGVALALAIFGMIGGSLAICMAIFGIFGASLDGERLSRWARQKSSSGWRWYSSHLVGSFCLSAVLVIAPYVSGDWGFEVTFTGLIWGHLLGLRARREMTRDIQPVETLGWSWKATWKRCLIGLGMGIIGWFTIVFVWTLDF